MRENTKKALVWLYSTTGKTRLVQREVIDEIWSDLSEAGRKSLLYFLLKEGLLEVEQRGGEWWRLTEWGKREVEREMPALKSVSQNEQISWQLIILGESPVHDPEFRQLRRELKTKNTLMLVRGVYLYPKLLENDKNDGLMSIFGQYLGSVWITANCDLVFGDMRKTIFSKLDLNSLIRSYSGISRDVERLLDNKKAKKISIQRCNDSIMEIYNRLFYIGLHDNGYLSLLNHFDVVKFGKSIDFRTVLEGLQKLRS